MLNTTLFKKMPALIVATMVSLCLAGKTPVEYVNPYIGNVSHLLVPTFPTIHLPNSMLRIYPDRADYTSEYVNGLPIIITNHRERSAFKLMPQLSETPTASVAYNYDNEKLTPYSFYIEMDDNRLSARLAVSRQSALYEVNFLGEGARNIVLSSSDGVISTGSNWLSGWQTVGGQTRVYLYLESEEKPFEITSLSDNCKVMRFSHDVSTMHLRYGVSFISEEQAKKNLRRELHDYDLDALAERGKAAWNEVLSRIEVAGGTEDEKTVFYTSYYRNFERPVCLSEDGKYWSGEDNSVHDDGGVPFYNEDWIWDTYHGSHPLRAITDSRTEQDILASFLRMTEQNGTGWIPTFPGIDGDSRRMNCNHTVASYADALWHGLKTDAVKAFEACRGAIEDKSLAPWSGNMPAGYLSSFYREHGYIPALKVGEKEREDSTVHVFENRQAVAVTLGTAYDEWCLSRIAEYIATHSKDTQEVKKYRALQEKYQRRSLNYRNLYYAPSGFFYPKDRDGNFLPDFDPTYGGTMGAREYYDENNGWVYRWDVTHNIADLVELMGGAEQFKNNLDQMFAQPLGKIKFEFYHQFPDHTGNVGQFSMANEPAMHIPYLYNYAGYPWKTQKRVRQMIDTWFRNDVMGVPGDEDGGGLTSFVVFSMMGFYPVTPGLPVYNLASPVFSNIKVHLSTGATLKIEARGASRENKYIQSATLNGKEWNKAWFSYDDVKDGATLVLEMGSRPNKTWGVGEPVPSGVR